MKTHRTIVPPQLEWAARLTSAAKADHLQAGECRPEGLLHPKAVAALPILNCFMPVWE